MNTRAPSSMDRARGFYPQDVEARDRMPQIERMLVAAWNAACAAGEAT